MFLKKKRALMARVVGTVPLCPALPAWLIMHMRLIICISDVDISMFPCLVYHNPWIFFLIKNFFFF